MCLVIFSSNDAPATTPPWWGLNFQCYRQILPSNDLWRAFADSLSLGLVASMISVTLGMLIAFAFRWPFRSTPAVFALLLLPMLTPGIVFGVALMLLWRVFGLTPSPFTSTLVAHMTYARPFAFLVVFTRLHRFDRSRAEAAMDLGADPLPLILPGFIAAAILCFMLSFDEFIRTLFVVGNEDTLPIFLWSMIMSDSTPQTSAVRSVIVAFSLTWILVGHAYLLRK